MLQKKGRTQNPWFRSFVSRKIRYRLVMLVESVFEIQLKKYL